MKLRFRKNSLRLRLNQLEVQALSGGQDVSESIEFPGSARLEYILKPTPEREPKASFTAGVITIQAPADQLQRWSDSDEIGIYFDLPANGSSLRVAIEKDLECVEGPVEERDPNAFPRSASRTC